MIHEPPVSPNTHRIRASRGFTVIEIMIVLLIMGLMAGIGLDTISAYEASTRPERAARECLIAFRHARQLAMSTNKSTKVVFDTSTHSFSVYWKSNGTTWDANPVPQPAAIGGKYTVTMNNAPELTGVRISVSPAGITTFTYNALGNLDTTGSVNFTYGTRVKTLTICSVGDPAIN